MSKKFRIKLHNEMVKRCERVTRILSKTEPGCEPEDVDFSLAVTDVITVATFLLDAYDSPELSDDDEPSLLSTNSVQG